MKKYNASDLEVVAQVEKVKLLRKRKNVTRSNVFNAEVNKNEKGTNIPTK